MQLPPFMSVDRIATLCEWPTADRRKLVRQLRLVGTDENEIDYHNETEFWNAVAPFFSNPSAYRTLTSNLKQLSNRASGRRLDQKAFENLNAKVRFPRSIWDADRDFLSRVVVHAADNDEASGELADWLWAAWLAGFPAQSVASSIDGHERLRDLFGSWRPPIGDVNEEAPKEQSDHVTEETTTGDHVGVLFQQVRCSIEEAEQLGTDEPLATAVALIEELAGLLRSRREEGEQLKSALAEFRAVRDRLRTREEPVDKQAASRLRKALDRFADPPSEAPYVEIKRLADTVAQLVNEADAARSVWGARDTAHRDSPFDREVRQAWIDALDFYQQAEGKLAGFIEEAASQAIERSNTALPGDTKESAPSEGERVAGNTPLTSLPVEVSGPVVAPNEGAGDKLGSPDYKSDTSAANAGALAGIENSTTNPRSADQEKQIASATQPDKAEAPSRIDGTGDGERSVANEDDEQLAATFLYRNDIGLFEITCAAGEGLNYRLPPSALARLLGLSGIQDAETQLRFTEALQVLMTTAPNYRVHQGETWLRLAALSLPAVTDTTLLCRTALEQLKLDGPMVVEAKSLQSAIVSLDRAYPALEAFAQTNALDAEQESKDAKADLRSHVGLLKGSTLAYQAATVVAHKLARAFDSIATSQQLDPNAVEGMINAVMRIDETDEAVIKRLDKEVRGATAERKPIEARALVRLKDIIKELKTKATRLTRALELLREQRASNPRTIEATHRKGTDLARRFKSSAEAFDRLARVQPGVNAFSATCAAVAAKLLHDHAQAFENGSASNPFRQALECDRFRLPIRVRRPDLTPEATWTALKELALNPAMNWLQAFEVALDRREHLASEALLGLAIPLAHGRLLDGEREEAIVAARNHVETERSRLRDDLLTVMNYAPAGETSLDPLYQGVAEIDVKALPRSDASLATAIGGRVILDFPDALAEIATAKESVRRVRTSALKELEDRITKLEGTASTDTVASLRKLVDNDELITLAEELSLVERGQDIKVATPGPIAIEEFSRFLSSHAAVNPGLAEWERSQDFPDGSRARTLVRKWLNLRTLQGEPLKRAVRDALGELGFIPEREASIVVSESLGGSRIRQFSAKVRTIADREFCSVARFGSEAEGQYRIVLPSQDARLSEIVTAVPEGDAGATLVFAQKWLTPEERRAIAAESRRLGRSFCLMDDGLLAFLCSRQHVLRDLFACGVPFSSATPYVTTSGSIPVEAFFGRNAEFEEIRRRNGSCIVYGGRQLGKSVLLDHIEKRSRTSEKSVTMRLDCQGLTERRDILGLIDSRARPQSAHSKLDILTALEQWLEEDAPHIPLRRRVLASKIQTWSRMASASRARNHDFGRFRTVSTRAREGSLGFYLEQQWGQQNEMSSQ
jgi:hypothetical protein